MDGAGGGGNCIKVMSQLLVLPIIINMKNLMGGEYTE